MTSENPYSLGQRLIFGAAIRTAAFILNLLGKSLSISVLNPEVERDYMDAGRSSLLVTWHRSWLGGVLYMGPRWHPAVMASLSKDGEWVARFESYMQCHPIRGSSTKGGTSAHKAMIRFVKQGGKVATNVADGPQGPRYVAKAGMISLAQITGAPLIPVMWSSNRAWCFRRSWDKTIIPKPFAKCVVLYGEPIEVPRRMSREQVEGYRQRLEDELNRIKEVVDDLCGYLDP